jgi:hypothetical protein
MNDKAYLGGSPTDFGEDERSRGLKMKDGMSEQDALTTIMCSSQDFISGGEGFLDELEVRSVDVSVEEYHL